MLYSDWKVAWRDHSIIVYFVGPFQITLNPVDSPRKLHEF